MNALAPAPSILDSVGVSPERAREILGEALAGADDGELFVERSESEAFLFDDGRLKSASYDSSEGFGLRVVAGETAGYSHSSEVSEAAIRRAASSSSLVVPVFPICGAVIATICPQYEGSVRTSW